MLTSPIKISILRAYVNEIIFALELNKLYALNNISRNIEVIPSIDFVMPGGEDRYINLPFYCIEKGLCPLIFQGERISNFSEAISILCSRTKHNIHYINEWLRNAPVGQLFASSDSI